MRWGSWRGRCGVGTRLLLAVGVSLFSFIGGGGKVGKVWLEGREEGRDVPWPLRPRAMMARMSWTVRSGRLKLNMLGREPWFVSGYIVELECGG